MGSWRLGAKAGLAAFFGLFVFPLSVFCFAGQALYFRVFHAYMARDTVRLGIALRGTLGAWLAAWGGSVVLMGIAGLGRDAGVLPARPHRRALRAARVAHRSGGRLRGRRVLLLDGLRRVAVAPGRAARHLLHPRRRARPSRRGDPQRVGATRHLFAPAAAAASFARAGAPAQRAAHRHRERARRRVLLGPAAAVQGAVPRRGGRRSRPPRAPDGAGAGHALVVRDALDRPRARRRHEDDAERARGLGGRAGRRLSDGVHRVAEPALRRLRRVLPARRPRRHHERGRPRRRGRPAPRRSGRERHGPHARVRSRRRERVARDSVFRHAAPLEHALAVPDRPRPDAVRAARRVALVGRREAPQPLSQQRRDAGAHGVGVLARPSSAAKLGRYRRRVRVRPRRRVPRARRDVPPDVALRRAGAHPRMGRRGPSRARRVAARSARRLGRSSHLHARRERDPPRRHRSPRRARRLSLRQPPLRPVARPAAVGTRPPRSPVDLERRLGAGHREVRHLAGRSPGRARAGGHWDCYDAKKDPTEHARSKDAACLPLLAAAATTFAGAP